MNIFGYLLLCGFFFALSNARKPNVLLIYTGGTIGMVPSEGGFKPEPGYLERQLTTYPQFSNELTPNYTVKEFNPLLDSSNISPRDWLSIAEAIGEEYDNYDGFVVIHGTDTMAYTSSALPFLLENLNKTVVVTGSMIPLCMGYTDGLFNLLGATWIAGKYQIPEVLVFIDNKLYRGNRMQKVNSWSVDAFDSGNFPPLGRFGASLRISEDLILPFATQKYQTMQHISEQVVELHLFPGITGDYVRAAVPRNTKGVVLMAFGAGNAPTGDSDFMKALTEILARQVVVVDATQCHKGGVDLDEYATGKGLEKIGVISGYDITPEAAFGKLSSLLARNLTYHQVHEAMRKPLRGEVTVPNTARFRRA